MSTDRAREILGNSVARYASMSSYADNGAAQRWSEKGARGSLITFSTLYKRPSLFRFEFFRGHPYPKLSHIVTRYTVGFDGTNAYTLVEKHANGHELTVEPHISAAVAGATGVSSGSAHTLARLLLPEVGGFSILDLVDLQLREDTVLDRTLCYCIAARHPEGGTEELWLEKDTLLLRKVVSNMGWFSSEELRRDIRIDVPLEDKLFRPPSIPKAS